MEHGDSDAHADAQAVIAIILVSTIWAMVTVFRVHGQLEHRFLSCPSHRLTNKGKKLYKAVRALNPP